MSFFKIGLYGGIAGSFSSCIINPIDVLKSRGQAPIVINRIHPAVESAKSMLTANRPSFRAAPREDSDNKVAQVMSNLLAYMYDISDGQTVIRQAVDDYYVMGVGYLHVYCLLFVYKR